MAENGNWSQWWPVLTFALPMVVAGVWNTASQDARQNRLREDLQKLQVQHEARIEFGIYLRERLTSLEVTSKDLDRRLDLQSNQLIGMLKSIEERTKP